MTDALWSLITAPWALRPDTLFGATLLLVAAALLGEVVWRALRWPRLMGYGIVGTVLAMAGMGADDSDTALRLAVDVAIALLLFETGARLNLRWLVHNRCCRRWRCTPWRARCRSTRRSPQRWRWSA
jgi:hypothetical protein